MRIRFTEEAAEQLVARKAWWREYRSATAELFDEELRTTIEFLVVQPRVFPVVKTVDGREIRR